MDKILKQKWVDALRSGEFKQLTPGGAHWKRGDKHCCLGVLGELLGEHERMKEHSFSRVLRDLSALEDWYDPLIEMNDSGKSFAEIADYIEKRL